jgi:hypothetical protein
MPSGFTPTLSMSYDRVFVRRNTKPDTGSRQSGQQPEPEAKAKDRAPKAIAVGVQGCW